MLSGGSIIYPSASGPSVVGSYHENFPLKRSTLNLRGDDAAAADITTPSPVFRSRRALLTAAIGDSTLVRRCSFWETLPSINWRSLENFAWISLIRSVYSPSRRVCTSRRWACSFSCSVIGFFLTAGLLLEHQSKKIYRWRWRYSGCSRGLQLSPSCSTFKPPLIHLLVTLTRMYGPRLCLLLASPAYLLSPLMKVIVTT